MVSATWPQRPSTQQAPKRSPSHFTPGSHPPARPLCAAFLGNPLVPITNTPSLSASRWRRALGAPAALPALSSAIQDLPGFGASHSPVARPLRAGRRYPVLMTLDG